MSDDRVLTALDYPPPHLVRFGATNRFRGMVLDSGGRVARSLAVRVDGRSTGEFPADLPSPDVASHLPNLPAARSCRFDFELSIPNSPSVLDVATIWKDDGTEPLFEYDLGEVKRSAPALERMRRALDAIPMPSGDVVHLTQGHEDVEGYRNSIIPGIRNMRRYLAACGIASDRFRRVLDFGCGSGRLMSGWLLEASDASLTGCDSSEALAGWARANLPSRLRIDHTAPLPPLPYADGEFDFAYAASVFTHLRFRSQELWARELARVIEPGGTLLVTLHGESFVELFLPNRVAEFRREGHLENENAEDGSNALASFHAPESVDTLFDRFERIEHFPSGRIDGRRVLFPIAGLQDVYVLRRR